MERRRRRFLPGSIRFRLTAWYALLLALVLVVLGFSLLGLARERLREDIDDRLRKTALDIDARIESNLNMWSEDRRPTRPTLEDISPDLRAFTARGLLVQIVS